MAAAEQSLTQFQKVYLFPALCASAQPQTCPMALCLEDGAMELSQECFARELFSQLLVQGPVPWCPGPPALWERSGLGGGQHRATPVLPVGVRGHPPAQSCAWPGCVFCPMGPSQPPGCGHVFNSFSKATSFSFWAKTDKSR